MLGSSFEAEDAVQDTLVRAWRAMAKFEGRSSMRSWLYKIATNVCFDMLDGRQRRALPMDFGPAQSADSTLGPPLPEVAWLQPIPDARVVPADSDPAQVAELRESIRLAFVATLQHLPPRQRAVLILREVLQWPAADVADLLGSSVASVNSALQRARATLAASDITTNEAPQPLDDEQRELLARYVDAFERYDMTALTSLLAEDASWSMPPYELWLQTHADIVKWCTGPGYACEGSKLVPTSANGAPAYAQYKPDPAGGYSAWSLQVVDVVGDRIAGLMFFLDVESYYPMFGLPLHLDA
jgi:RNA polymerase sigma-70 factor (ECF subfamily)